MRLFGILLLILLCSGCATVDPRLLMNRSTSIDLINVSEDIINTSEIDQVTIKAINNRIIKSTASYLSDYGIANDYKNINLVNAKLEISVDAIEASRDLMGKRTFKIKYSYNLQNKGKILLRDKNDKETNSVDDLCDSIGKSIAKKVRKFFIAEG